MCGVWFAAATAATAATDFSDYSLFGSASSTQVSTIKIGATTDTETVITANTAATGDDITGTDDEDGVTLPASVVLGAASSMTVNVTNSSGASAFLNVWIDFNRNGVLTDAGEQVASNTVISTGTSNSNKTVSFTVPASATAGTAGVRVRLTSTSTPGSIGLSGNGEVEDNIMTLACPAITFSPTTLTTPTVGTAYSQSISASGPTTTFTYAVTSGTLPAGLTLSSAGVLSGTATSSASATFTVTATGANTCAASQAYTVTPSCPNIIVTLPTPTAAVGTAYSRTLTAVNGTAPYSYTLTSGTLPSWATLTSAGVLSGTPNSTTSYTFNIKATDAYGCTGTSTSYTIMPTNYATLTVGPASLSAATANSAYSQTITATQTLGFSVQQAFSSSQINTLADCDALISGTNSVSVWSGYAPTISFAGSSSSHYTDTMFPGGDGDDFVVHATATITIPTAGAWTFGISSDDGARLKVDGTAVINDDSQHGTADHFGTVTLTAGTHTIDLVYFDRSGGDVVELFAAAGTLSSYSSSFQLVGSASGLAIVQSPPAYTYALKSGTLPAWSTLNSGTGVLSGTPNTTTSSTFTIQATDTNGYTGTSPSYTITPVCPTVSLTPATLPSANVSSAYNQTVTASGGISPYTYAVSSGSLPTGLTLSSAGVISGTSTSSNGAGANVTIRATDANGCQGSLAYTLIVCPVISIAQSSLPQGTVGTAYSQTLTASGGAASYRAWTITSGALPAGLTLNASTGVISGTPTASASPATSITVRVNDANGCQGSQTITLQICPLITLSPATLATPTAGTAYSQSITASGSGTPYTYTVSSGSLPAGLTLSTTGVLSGTPTSTNGLGTSVTIRANDANGCQGSLAYNLQVCPAISLSPTTLPAANVNALYSQTIAASGGASAYTYAIITGSLPAGLTLNSSAGAISGTPTSTTAATFTLSVTDANNCVVTSSYTITPTTTDFGDFASFGTASSTFSSNLKLGTLTDTESAATTNATATGDDITGIDDEDGVTLPAYLVQGTSGSMTVNVTNNSGASAFLNVWIDFNNNGLLTDSGEQIATNTVIATGTSNSNKTVSFTVPATASIGTLGVRVRLTSTGSPGSTGLSGNGEVEDYVVNLLAPTDFGDFSLFGISGSTSSTTLRMGALIDSETPTLANATATGDDTTGVDDEDGVTLPATVTQGQTGASVTVNVTNTTGADTYLNGWIDFNNNGVLTDAGEQIVVNDVVSTGTSGVNRAYTFTIPGAATIGVIGVRFRLCSVATPGDSGAVGSGEVEDNTLTVLPASDHGDFSLFADASSYVTTGLTLGNLIDSEVTPVTNLAATGDDITNIADEEGVTLQAILVQGQAGVAVTVKLNNATGAPAYLNGWVDLNNNGVVTDAGEQVITNSVVSTGTTDGYQTFFFDVPSTAALGVVGARFRLTSVASPGPTGADGNGEVEDYTTTIVAPSSNFRDYFYTIRTVSGHFYLDEISVYNPNSSTPTVSVNQGILDLNVASPGFDTTATDAIMNGLALDWLNRRFYWAATSTGSNGYNFSLYTANYDNVTKTWNYQQVTNSAMSNVPLSTGAPVSATASSGAFPRAAFYAGEYYAGGQLSNNVAVWHLNSNGLGLNTPSFTDYTNFFHISQTFNGGDFVIRPQDGLLVTSTVVNNANTLFTQFISNGFNPSGPAASTTNIDAGIPYASNNSVQIAGVGGVSRLYALGSGGSTVFRIDNYATATPTAVTVGPLPTASYPDLSEGMSSSVTSLGVKGIIYNDANGLSDGLLSGTGTNVGGTLYAMLVDGSGNLVDSFPVKSDGTFILGGATANTTYKVVLSTSYGSLGSTAPVPALPTGWLNAGEFLGSGAGSDGTVDGRLTVAIGTVGVVNATFGITQTLGIGNQVWNDVNNNGLFDTGESGISSVTVQLWNPGSDNAIGGTGTAADTQLATTTTDATGTYAFANLGAGKYFVTVTPPALYSLVSSTAAGDNGIDNDNKGTQTGGRGTTVYSPVITLAPGTEPGGTGTGNMDNTIDFGLLAAIDYGDYALFGSAGSAQVSNLFIGTLTDSEYSAIVDNNATGDDLNNLADEDGVVVPTSLYQGTSASLTVTVTNTSGAAAFLNAWVDFNANGALTDTGEQVAKNVVIANGTNASSRTITFTVPAGATQGKVGIRVRLSSVSTPGSVGTVGNGEVEDYVSSVCPVVTLAPATLPTATVGSAFSQTFTASGGAAPYTYSVSSGALPAWATLSSGILSGTPNSPTAATFTVKATDANGCSGTVSFTVTPLCLAISITPTALAPGTVGTAYSQTLTASGGGAPYGSWTLTSGTLPAGLTLNASTGVISGTPTASASPTTTLTFRVNDAYGCQATQAVTLQVCPVVTLAPATLPTPTVGTAYSQTLTTSGGATPYTYTVSSGALPAWATLSSAGVLSGTPTTTTAATFTVKAADANGCAVTLSYTVTPVCPTITITPAALPQGTIGTSYSQTLTASGGTSPYSTWTITSGSLPLGLTLNSSTGVISGIPLLTAAPATTITVRVNDANGCQGSRSITVLVCPVLILTPTTLPTPTVGTAYSQTMTATGSATSYTYTVSSGALPAWATLSSAGLLSGTPNSTTPATFTVKATDANGCAVTLSYTLTPVCPTTTIAQSALPQGTVGTAYSQTLTASGGTAPYGTWTLTSGTLPAGLTLNASTGVISGTPTASASPATTLTVRVNDTYGCQGTQSITLQICPVLTLAPATPATGTVGTAYTQTITASGGAASYTFAVASGTLPAGLTLNAATGVVSGTPTTQVSSNVTLRATDANGCAGTIAVTFAISCPVITVAPASLVLGTVGSAYSQTITASGGSSSYVFAVSSGTLPAGLTLNASTGVINGTPTTSNAAGTSITISATDSFNCSGTKTYNLQVCPVITLAPATLPTPTVGTAYSQTITSSGGAASYSYTLASGSLPAWATLSPAGLLSGTPNNTTAATFTVKATDAYGCTGTLAYTVTPVCPTITIAQSSLPQSTVGTAYSQTLTASGGIAPYSTWTITSGTLPTGLTLNASTGVISGTPTASASPATSITVRANDTNGCQGSRTITLQVCPVVTLTPSTLPNGTINSAYSQTVTASGGMASYVYAVSSGSLPAGLALNTSTGVISGTPTSVSSVTFVLSATDANGCATTQSYTVAPAPDTDYSDFSLFGTAGSRMTPTLLIGATTDTEATATTNTTATGDDITGIDDEDGVTIAASITQGAAASMTVNVTNTSGASAFLNVWIDFNNNGVITDAGEQIATNTVIATGTSNAARTINFFTPVNATLGVVGVRSRLTSTSSPGSTGTSGNGEVEDVVTTITAPTTDFGDFSLFADAWSTGSNNLILGALVDLEGTSTLNATATGDDITNLDDEDGVAFPSMTAGQPITLPVTVTNLTGAAAYLNAWIDFNNNGVLTDAGEQIATNVSIATGTNGGTASLTFTVPTNAVTAATTIGTRFRLTSVASPGPTGAAGTGEVEDHGVTLLAPLTDFSDFSGVPNTSNTASTNLRLGALVDTEYAPTVNASATGDDLTGVDDEDGVTLPAMTAGAPATVAVVATNITGAGAYLNAWIDFNNNGVFTDSGEQIATNTSVPSGTTNGAYNLTFTVPANAVTGTNLGVRVRVTADISPGSTGAGGVGEVEDNIVNIALPTTDFGDYSLFSLVNATTDSRLRLGALTDTEYVATTNATATGDDITNLADEDSVILPSMIAGAPATIPVVVTNTLGATAFLNAWIDYNGNGSLADAGEQIATNVTVSTGTTNTTKNLSITVPATCLTGVNLGVRVMLTATASPVSTGNVGTGEIEDYVVNIAAPTTDFGDFSSFADASQGINPSLRMGALVDAEYVSTRNATATGDDITNLADEDGVTLPSMTASQTVTIQVVATNSTGALGYLNAWIDYNNNGVLTDAGEQIATNINVPTGSSGTTFNISVTVPISAVTGTNVGARFRLSAPTSPGPVGANAASGEVEDYVVNIAAPTLDFSDFSGFANAASTASNGLRMGALVDTEYAATVNSAATGDNITNLNDEDGVTLPTLSAGLAATIPVVVTNTSGAAAYLNAWIDYNNNGVLTDAGEQIATNLSIATGTSGVTQNLSVTVPYSAVTGTTLGVRFRLTSVTSPGSTGTIGTGEVEDYVTSIVGATTDYGDWSGIADASNTIVSTLRLGALIDAEFSSTKNATATGDDITYLADEDGVTLPAMTAGGTFTVPVIVTNTSGATAYLNAWIDFNNNGSLSDAGEQIATNVSVANGLTSSTLNQNVTVPANAVTGVNLGVRFRLTATSSPGTTGTGGGNGEVEDYVTTIAAPTTDFGDFSNFASASSTMSSTLRLGALEDTEYVATTNLTATGDDITNLDDEDGVTLPSMTAGAPATIPVIVTNNTGAAAYLNAWIDYNNNGVLTDAGEQIATNVTIATGTTSATQNLSITVPANALTGTNLGVRVRLTSVSSPGSTGAAGIGEVEDYVVSIITPPLDYGDWSGIADAASNVISTLRLGALTDTEYVSTRNATATGDDITNLADEDGVTLPAMTAGAPATIPVIVTNNTGAAAYLNVWIDYNNNGVLTDAGEQLATNLSIATGTTNSTQNLNITVPAGATAGANIGIRVRLTSVASPGVTGTVGNGEVEDYVTTIAVPTTDFGDWISAADASSIASSNLRMGAIVDTEYVSTRNATATGDDITNLADEDGVTVPSQTPGTAGSATVVVTNNTGAMGYLNAWIDFNNNGSFADSGEQIATNTSIATGTNGVVQTLDFVVPVTAIPGQRGARFRLTSTQNPTSVGASGTGEVEDYLVTMTCLPIALSPTTLTTPTVGTAYSQTVTASGSTTPYTYSIGSGALPAGLTLSSAGVISGTPTSSSSATFSIVATDTYSCTGSLSYTVTPVCPTITVSPGTLPSGSVGTAYSQTLSASGGTAGYTFAVSSGTLPTGLTLNASTGVISGTPTTSNASGVSLTFKATDAHGCTGTDSLTLIICPVITLTPATLPAPTVGTAYSQTLAGSGGAATYTFTLASGTLPTWATLSSSGVLSGTPTSTTAATFTVRATDANGCTGTLSYTVTPVCPTITVTPAALAQGTVGTAYSQSLAASGGVAPYGTWTITAGTLPAGLSLNASTGVISGTPTASASPATTITFRVNDANGCQGSRAITLQVCPVITVAPATLTTPTVGTAYSQTITASGGSAAYTYTVSSGALPAWAALSSAGVLSGTPNNTTAATFTVKATDANGCAGTLSYTVTPVCPTITIAQSALPQGTVGTAYSQTLTASGGIAPYSTWSITTGTLPTGLTLNASTGVISGTPTASASPATSITVSVNDTNGCQGTKNITLQICPVVTLSPTTLPTPTIGTAYSQTLSASGGTSAYTYTVSSGALPAWATLSSAGILSGTPNNTTAATFTVKATDANGCAGTLSYTVTPVCPAISITPTSLAQGTVSTAYSQTLAASGGTAPYGTWAITTGTLPTGLTLNASTGIISGTPTATASPATSITVRVNDTYGCQSTQIITLQICPVVTVSPATLTTPTVGTAYSQTLTAAGGTSAYTYTVSSGALPAWATLSSGGVLSGTPNSSTAATFTVKATDVNGCAGTRSYTITPVCPTITIAQSSLPQGTVGTAYSQTLTASGGIAPYSTWTITAGTLPAGLTLDSVTGIISGTPTASASPATSITVRTNDANGCQGSRAVTLQICPVITLAPATPATGTVGTAYSQTITASGGATAYTFAVASGTLPAGLTLNASTGVVSGTPTTQISSNVTLRATDANGCQATLAVTFAISCPVITVAPTTLALGTVGSAYSQTITASGGSSSYVFAVSSGTLPAGLTLNSSTGVISGTPTTSNAGGVSITFSATDSFSCSGTKNYTLQICPVITLSPATLPTPTVGTAYSQTITAAGGAASYTYTLASGTLPAWATLSSSGVLSGTPTSTTSATFTVRAADANGCTGTLSYTVTPVCPAITITQSALPQGTVGTSYSQTLTASGGIAPYSSWTITAGTLPAGLTLNASTGIISGTPTASASPATSITVRASDANGCQGSRSITLQICPVITLAPATLTTPTVGTAYSQTITASGGTAAYTYTVSSGALPAWATLSSTGVLSGTPNNTTSATFTVKATDANGCAGTLSYTVTPVCPTITIAQSALPQGTVGTAYSQTLTASGGISPYSTWTITTGTLPTGLTLNASTGVINGTPTASASPATTITVTVNDTNGCQGTKNITLQICPVLTLSPATLPTPTVGTAYSQPLSASGGTSAYTYTVSSGALPAWATLSSAGVLAGTPNNTTAATFTVKATDANGCAGTLSYTITPVCPAISITPISLTQGTVSTAYSQTLAASGGTAPYGTWAITTGTLPTGLTLNASTGVISGTPTASASPATSITVRVNDTYGCQGTQVITLQICPVITVSPTTLAAPTVNTAYSQTITAAGGTATYTYTLSSGALPAWATLSSAGVLSGTPTTVTSATFTVKATDANGCASTRSYTLTPACQTITVAPATLPNGTVNSAYSQTITSSGSVGTVTFAISSGSLPAGLSLNTSTGVISGTPTSTTAATFTVRATDANGCTGSTSYTVTPACPTIIVTPTTLATGGVGVAYSQTLAASGGISPYASWTVTTGTLPAGLTLSASTGVITGTPTTSNGTGVNVTIRTTDANGCQGSAVVSIKICPVITQSPATLTTPVIGTAYSQTITGAGGVSPYTFTLTSGSLPSGMTLSSSGTISGTTPSGTSATFTVKATAADGCSGTASYTLTPVCPALTPSPTTLPIAYLGASYTQTIATTGGTAPYTYSLFSGSLPGGIQLSSAGTFSGTPTAQGSFPISVVVTDANGCSLLFKVSLQVHTLSIGNLVFEDSNNNGLFDTGEPGVANATVQLFTPGSDNAIGGTDTAADVQVGSDFTTDATGAYLFSNLPAGSYYVKVTPPVDYLYTGGTPDTADDSIDNNNDGAQPGGAGTPLFSPIINLVGGQESITDGDTNPDTNLTVDFGLWSSVAVGNFIFLDINGDGHRNEGESLGNIYVELYAQGTTPGVDNPVSVGTSGCSCKGRYYLDGLNPGSYFLHIPASQFSAGMPLQGLLPMSTVVLPADDDVGQDLIYNSNPAVNGASTRVFSLRPGYCPVGAAESGAEGNSDDAIDARVDLTMDLGIVAPAGTGFAASELIRRYIVTGGFVANVPAGATTFALWSQDSTIGGATDDPDQDGMPNLLEYALGTDPTTPLQPNHFSLTHDATTGSLTALLTQPSATHYDLIVSLETLTDITQSGNASAWKKLSMAATTTINADGTITRAYSNLENLLVFQGLDSGFLRLNVGLDANRDGIPEATVTSAIQGWGHQTFATGSRTFSMPLLNASSFTGQVSAVSSNQITLQYILTTLPAGSLYLDVLDGPLAGQRFDIDATSSSGNTLVLQNTSQSYAGLVNAHISIRVHHTLAELLPPAAFSNSDRVLFFDPSVSNYTTYTNSSGTWLNDVLSMNARPFAAHEAALLQVRGSGTALMFTGEVRQTKFVTPLVAGTQLIASTPWPVVTPAPVTGLSSGLTPDSADRFRIWDGDTTPSASDYTGYYLDGSTTPPAWLPQNAPAPDAYLFPFHGYFLIRTAPLQLNQTQPW